MIHIYLVKIGNLYNIGYAKAVEHDKNREWQVEHRIDQYFNYYKHPFNIDVEVIRIIENDQKNEFFLHHKFAKYGVHGEFFEPNKEILDWFLKQRNVIKYIPLQKRESLKQIYFSTEKILSLIEKGMSTKEACLKQNVSYGTFHTRVQIFFKKRWNKIKNPQGGYSNKEQKEIALRCIQAIENKKVRTPTEFARKNHHGANRVRDYIRKYYPDKAHLIKKVKYSKSEQKEIYLKDLEYIKQGKTIKDRIILSRVNHRLFYRILRDFGEKQ